MRTPKGLYRTSPTIYRCELETCPTCHAPMSEAHYLNGLKTVQTMTAVQTIAYRPKLCVNPDCPDRTVRWPAAAWQASAPKYGTYGYDVIAQIGWERQRQRARFADVLAHLTPRLQISEAHVRHLYHCQYLPLLACQERQRLADLQKLAQPAGLLLGMDGLMPEGGEPQLWLVRELQTGWTLRSGWLDRQDEATFVAFLQPIADLGLPVQATLSDKQAALLSALKLVFPQARHGLCQLHYFKNAAQPVADADERMKIALRQTVRHQAGDLLRPNSAEKPAVLTVTGLLPSPTPAPAPAPADTRTPVAAADTKAGLTPQQEAIVQDLLQRTRYLLTLKGRPPFRLAGVEMFEQLQAIARCVDQLLRHAPCPEPRLLHLRAGLRAALRAVRADYQDLRQAADWLTQIADVLDPDGKPARTAAAVRADWEECLREIDTASQDSPRLQGFAEKISQVSESYAPGLFHTYDVPGLPRTNNERESEFREVKRRLFSTTGQTGAVKRLLLREGAWELIPGLGSLAETVAAISRVATHELREEQQRVQTHRRRFRLHTRSAKQSQAQLKDLVHRWRALPVARAP